MRDTEETQLGQGDTLHRQYQDGNHVRDRDAIPEDDPSSRSEQAWVKLRVRLAFLLAIANYSIKFTI